MDSGYISRPGSNARFKKLGEGSFGVVYRAEQTRVGLVVAIKQMTLDDEEKELPSRFKNEIALLKTMQHPNIVKLQSVHTRKKWLFMVFECLEMDLRKYLDQIPQGKYMDKELVKSYMHQVTQGILYCHIRRILHRDIKPQNLLITRDGRIKVADFALSRPLAVAGKQYSEAVGTLWYRAPELLLGCTTYCSAIDIWSMGCTFAEMVTKTVLFQGDSESNQLAAMFRILRTPTEEIWEGISSLPGYKDTFPKLTEYKLQEEVGNHLSGEGFELLELMLRYDPFIRTTADAIAEHPYFNTVNLKIAPVFE